MADKEKRHSEKLTQQDRHEIALDLLRRTRWVTDELTDTEMKEDIKKLGPWIADEFAFYDEHVVSTGSGVRITARGRLYMRMEDGL